MHITTQRLLLRPFTAADLDNVFAGLSHPDVIRYYGVSYTTREAATAQIQFFSDLEKNGTGQWFAICDIAGKIFYGACGLNNVHTQHRKAEIGFWLLPAYWGQGIITEAVPLVCQFGFTHFNLHRIEAVIEHNNDHSKKVMAKTGFQYEGTMRECEIKNGTFISLDIYARLKE